MALVCPVDHPPGVGTAFCRICGRTYVEVEDAFAPEPELALVGAPAPVTPPPDSLFLPAPERKGEAVVNAPNPALPVPAAPAPVVPPTLEIPAPAGPPVQARHAAPAPAEAPAPFAPPSPPAPQVELVPVVGPGAVQVHLPLVPAQAGPSPTDTVPLQLGGPTLTAEDLEHEPEDKPSKVRVQLDRTAVLAGVVGGFLGGAVSGAAVTLFLS
jgi:hypothetical protein